MNISITLNSKGVDIWVLCVIKSYLNMSKLHCKKQILEQKRY